jgi:hypothetical protein
MAAVALAVPEELVTVTVTFPVAVSSGAYTLSGIGLT